MNLPELSHEAKELVYQGWRDLQATTSDKERVRAALRARLAMRGDASQWQWAGNALGSNLFGKTLIGAIAVALAIGVATWIARRPPTPALDGSVVVPVQAPVDAHPLPLPPDPVPELVASASDERSSMPKSTARPGSPSSSDRLAEEAMLLMRAEKEYHAGHMSAALAFVNEHARKFPTGKLRQERVRLKADVMCGLGDEPKVCKTNP